MTIAERLRLAAATALFSAKRLLTGGHRMAKPDPAAAGRLYEFSAKTIDGKDKPLSAYKGQALLIVNTASLCGFTPQYEGLESLQKAYGPKGLRVLGFPANEFGSQEPGHDADIAQFCRTRYSVSFDLFSKIAVKGPAIHPLYRFLTTESGFNGDIDWNFAKFLVDRRGTVVARFSPEEDPGSPRVTAAIERALS
jgi:glutathione peroxidase